MNKMIVKITAPDAEGNIWETLFPYRVNYGAHSFLIPRHFKSDGASVPKIFWRVVFANTSQEAAAAGVCHDFIYRTQPNNWTRKEADGMFLSFLIENGASWFSANAAYFAVRLFGWIPWRKSKQRIEAERVKI